jgi:hypothetical protein
MRGSAEDPLIARIAAELRRPLPARPEFDARVMAAVRRSPPSLQARAWAWLREPRILAVSPLGGLAAAAGLAVLVLAGGWAAARRSGTPGAARLAAAPAAAAGAPALVTFVFVAPQARSVALAGDFDGWDGARMPMRRGASGLWTLDVPLAPGRYQYAFVVDGRRFVADPAAPPAVGDDFGQPTSVVTVAGGATRAAGGSL